MFFCYAEAYSPVHPDALLVFSTMLQSGHPFSHFPFSYQRVPFIFAGRSIATALRWTFCLPDHFPERVSPWYSTFFFFALLCLAWDLGPSFFLRLIATWPPMASALPDV